MTPDSPSGEQMMYTRFLKPFENIPTMGPEQAKRVREYLLKKAKKGVIMIDLDRNLTDDRYDLSEDGMDRVIKEVQDKEYLVCLNSSRSARKLRYWQDRVKTHFPTFAENGLILDIPDPEAGLNMQVVTDDRALLFNNKYRDKINTELKEKLKEKYPDIEIRLCADSEPEDTIRKAINEREWQNKENEYGIYINGWTKVKTVMYAFKKSPEKAQYDPEFTQAVLSALKEIRGSIPYPREVTYKNYDDDCSILTYPVEQNKTYIWRMLLLYLGDDAKGLKFYHMGDGKEDDIHDERVIVLGPANSREAIIERRRILPEKTKIAPEGYIYTKGVKYHLEQIIAGKYD